VDHNRRLTLCHYWVAFAVFLPAVLLGVWQMLMRSPLPVPWKLRAAVSLARLRQGKSCASDAHDLLAPSYARFTEGFETADLKTAKQLLNELA
jgi:hypothetical protein